jgi:uncharacterized protein YfdQ (DUF2303 family)
MEVDISKLTMAMQGHNLLDQTEAMVVKPDLAPYPLLITKWAGEDGTTCVSVDEKSQWSEFSAHKKGDVHVIEVASFVDFVNRHETPFTEIFMGISPGTGVPFVRAIIDGNQSSALIPSLAGHGRFVGTLNIYLTPDTEAWKAVQGKTYTQTALANLLEDLDHTIIDPPAADIRDVVMNLQGKSDVVWKSRRNLDNGNVALQYEENGTIGDIQFPHAVQVAVQLHESTEPTNFTARIQYLVKDGNVSFTVKVIGLAKAIEDSVLKIREKIEEETGIRVFR